MIGLHHIDQELAARQRFGQPYKNKELEAKRRTAVLYLRHCSKVGWWMDRIPRSPAKLTAVEK
jgi:hypothetical protein